MLNHLGLGVDKFSMSLVALACATLQQHGDGDGDGNNSSITAILNTCNCRTTVDQQSITDEGTGTFARIRSKHDRERINNVLTVMFIHCHHDCKRANHSNSDWRRLKNSTTGEKSDWIVAERQSPDALALSTALRMVGLDHNAYEETEADDLPAIYLNALNKWCASKLMKMSADEMAAWIREFIPDDTAGLWLGSFQTLDDYVRGQLQDQHRGKGNLFRFILINFAKVSGVIFAMV
jgi:hypothetical protein